MSIHETESGKIIARQGGTLKEFKEEFYEFIDSRASILGKQEYLKKAPFVMASSTYGAYTSKNKGFECAWLEVIINGDDFKGDEDLIHYTKRHEAAEIWTLLKPGYAIDDPFPRGEDGRHELNIDALHLTHGVGMRESFRLAVSEGRGRDFFHFLESKIREYCEGRDNDEDIKKAIQEQKSALEKAEDEKERGFLK